MSTVFRVVKNCNYTTLSNYHFKDKRLSWKAKGLLSTMLSLPDDWNYTIEGLSKLAADGIKATNSGLLELEKCGYLVRKQTRNSNGYFGLTEYIIYEQPIEKDEISEPEKELTEPLSDYPSQPLCQNGQTAENTAFSPYVQNRQTEKRFAEKGGQLNTNILNTKELNTSSSSPMDVQERMRRTQIDEEEEILRERLRINHIASKCSPQMAEAVLVELRKRDREFIRLMDARAFEKICLAIMEKQRQEPIRILPNLINTYLDNIMLGIKAAGNGSNGGRDSPLYHGNRKNGFNDFQQNEYDFSLLEKELLNN